MIENMEELAEHYRARRLSRRQFIEKALTIGMSLPVALHFLSAVEDGPVSAARWGPTVAYAQQKPLKAVLITIQRVGDLGPVDAFVNGLKRGGKELNYQTKVVEALQGEYQEAIEAAVNEGNDLIIGLFPPMGDALKQAAKRHPKKYFANLVGKITDDIPNLQSWWHAGETGTFLTGALAGFYTKKKKMGAVLAVENEEQWGYLAGYQQGFKYTSKSADFYHSVIGGTSPFEDPAKAKQLSLVLYERGCDVVGACGGKSPLGILDAAEEAGQVAMGMDQDACLLKPNHVLGSLLIDLDNWIYACMKELRTGAWKPGYHHVSVADGAMDLCPYTEGKHVLGKKLAKVVHDTMARLVADMKANRIKVERKPVL
jgi:basic membrane protein A